jgi:hypothetical protein
VKLCNQGGPNYVKVNHCLWRWDTTMLCCSSVGQEFANSLNLRRTGAVRFAPWRGGKRIAPGKRRGGGPVAQPGVWAVYGVSPGRATDISVALPGLVHCRHGIPRAALRLPGATISLPLRGEPAQCPLRGSFPMPPAMRVVHDSRTASQMPPLSCVQFRSGSK